MDEKLVKFVNGCYEMAMMCNDPFDVRHYTAQAAGACCYEYERTGDMVAINMWRDEWREKFERWT